MDRGVREDGEIVTPDALPRIVAIQAKVALDTGSAFFNTFEAMGGAGTMAKWYTSQPRLVSSDFMHPLPGGAAIVGRLCLYRSRGLSPRRQGEISRRDAAQTRYDLSGSIEDPRIGDRKILGGRADCAHQKQRSEGSKMRSHVHSPFSSKVSSIRPHQSPVRY